MTIPVFVRYLSNLADIIEKGEGYAAEKKLDVTILLNGKLAPDMYNFIKQVQYAYFMALEAAVKLSGRPMPKFTYDEKTLHDLQASLKRVIAFLKKIEPEEFSAVDEKQIETYLDTKKHYSAAHYVTLLALPNFFFHVTTAYDILRHLGVSLGKRDYLGL